MVQENNVEINNEFLVKEPIVAHSYKHIVSAVGLTPFYTNKDGNSTLFNADCPYRCYISDLMVYYEMEYAKMEYGYYGLK